MNQMLFVKPLPGMVVINPENAMRHLKPEGEWVPNNIFWRRRIVQEDVVQAPDPAAAPVASPAPQETETQPKKEIKK